ncbi:MAG: hypothetical protein IPK87_08360 [Planctomycetes bacterium]|nr:hypothetical protein [Planctomycetota bacterium]
MNDRIAELIRNAKPQAPSPDALLAALGSRDMPAATSGGVWLLRAAALFTLAAGIGAAAALLPRMNADTPAASDLERVGGLAARIESLESQAGSVTPEQVAEQEARIAALETQVQARTAIEQAVAEYFVKRDAAERELWQERHLEHVRRHYARDMEGTLAELKAQDLPEAKLVRAREILEQHGKDIEALIKQSYAQGGEHRRGHRDMRQQFASLARGAQDSLARVTGENNWGSLLGESPEDWAPTSEFEDLSDFDSMMNWMRRSSRS